MNTGSPSRIIVGDKYGGQRQFHWTSAVPEYLKTPTRQRPSSSNRTPTDSRAKQNKEIAHLPSLPCNGTRTLALVHSNTSAASQSLDHVPSVLDQSHESRQKHVPAILTALKHNRRFQLPQSASKAVARVRVHQQPTINFLVGHERQVFKLPTSSLKTSRMLTHLMTCSCSFLEGKASAPEIHLPEIQPQVFAVLQHALLRPNGPWDPIPVELCLVVAVAAIYLDLHTLTNTCVELAAQNASNLPFDGLPVPLIKAILKNVASPTTLRIACREIEKDKEASLAIDTHSYWLDQLSRHAEDIEIVRNSCCPSKTHTIMDFLDPPERQCISHQYTPTIIRLPKVLTAHDVEYFKTLSHRYNATYCVKLLNTSIGECIANRSSQQQQGDVSKPRRPENSNVQSNQHLKSPGAEESAEQGEKPIVLYGDATTWETNRVHLLQSLAVRELTLNTCPARMGMSFGFLCEWLETCSLEKLTISNCLHEEECCRIISSVCRKKCLKSLGLEFARIQQARPNKSIVKAIHQISSSNVTTLSLRGNVYLPSVIHGLLEELYMFSNLQSLDLRDMQLGMQLDPARLSTANWRHLHTLKLGGNRIIARALIQLIEFLADGPSTCMTHLDISNNQITSGVISALAHNWSKFAALKEIDLDLSRPDSAYEQLEIAAISLQTYEELWTAILSRAPSELNLISLKRHELDSRSLVRLLEIIQSPTKHIELVLEPLDKSHIQIFRKAVKHITHPVIIWSQPILTNMCEQIYSSKL